MDNHNYHSFEDSVLFLIDFERFLAANFTIREMVVSSMSNSGYKIREIAKHQGCSERYIKRIVHDIHAKFRIFFLDRSP